MGGHRGLDQPQSDAASHARANAIAGTRRQAGRRRQDHNGVGVGIPVPAGDAGPERHAPPQSRTRSRFWAAGAQLPVAVSRSRPPRARSTPPPRCSTSCTPGTPRRCDGSPIFASSSRPRPRSLTCTWSARRRPTRNPNHQAPGPSEGRRPHMPVKSLKHSNNGPSRRTASACPPLRRVKPQPRRRATATSPRHASAPRSAEEVGKAGRAEETSPDHRHHPAGRQASPFKLPNRWSPSPEPSAARWRISA